MIREERELLDRNERDERWLRSHAPEGPTLAAREHLRLRVRITAEEQWLEQFASPKPGPECIARTKQAVRHELGTSLHVVPFPGLVVRRMIDAVIPLSAAAVIVLGVFTGLWPTGGATPEWGLLDDLAYVMQQPVGQDTTELTEIASELDAIESALAGVATSSAYDDTIDDVASDTYDLLNELESSWNVADEPA